MLYSTCICMELTTKRKKTGLWNPAGIYFETNSFLANTCADVYVFNTAQQRIRSAEAQPAPTVEVLRRMSL